MFLVDTLRSRLQGRVRRWALKRYPRSRSVTLTQKRIFILPTRAGAGFMLLLLMLLIMGVNYENNLIYAITLSGSRGISGLLPAYLQQPGRHKVAGTSWQQLFCR